MDQKIESMLAPKRSVKEVNKPPAPPPASAAGMTPTSAAAAAAAAGAGLLGPAPTQAQGEQREGAMEGGREGERGGGRARGRERGGREGERGKMVVTYPDTDQVTRAKGCH